MSKFSSTRLSLPAVAHAEGPSSAAFTDYIQHTSKSHRRLPTPNDLQRHRRRGIWCAQHTAVWLQCQRCDCHWWIAGTVPNTGSLAPGPSLRVSHLFRCRLVPSLSRDLPPSIIWIPLNWPTDHYQHYHALEYCRLPIGLHWSLLVSNGPHWSPLVCPIRCPLVNLVRDGLAPCAWNWHDNDTCGYSSLMCQHEAVLYCPWQCSRLWPFCKLCYPFFVTVDGSL